MMMWTLTADIEKRIPGIAMRCVWRLLDISNKDHITNEEVRNRIRQAIGPYENLAKTILQGTGKEGEGEADRERDGRTTSHRMRVSVQGVVRLLVTESISRCTGKQMCLVACFRLAGNRFLHA